ncbi:MobC family plasmid mobilization relaxosome protein [Streptomyces anulatus]|uniref:MobC family plasmid mobilization relaxosome protein n=1 Tax=Streptomyces anulatus TaxID=1892 RepID=UPI003B7B4A5F
MAEPSAANGRRRSSGQSARYREREPDGRRDNRVKVSYTDNELTIIREAAIRELQAVAAWVGEAALNVAKEQVVPVSVDARDVVAELVKSRRQLARIGNNLNQIAKALNSDGTVTDAKVAAAAEAVRRAILRNDDATREVMRERRPRS